MLFNSQLHPVLQVPPSPCRTPDGSVLSLGRSHALSMQVLERTGAIRSDPFIPGQFLCQVSVRTACSGPQVVAVVQITKFLDPLVYPFLPVSIPSREAFFVPNPHTALSFDLEIKVRTQLIDESKYIPRMCDSKLLSGSILLPFDSIPLCASRRNPRHLDRVPVDIGAMILEPFPIWV